MLNNSVTFEQAITQNITSGENTGWVDSGYYPRSNPSGFITAGQTGDFYPISNPSGYITGVDTSSFITTGQTGSFYPKVGNPSGFVTSSQTGNLTSQFYPLNSNPAGYLTSASPNPLPYTYLTGTGIINAYTGTSGNYILGCGFSGASGVIVLPSGFANGYCFIIKDEIGRATVDNILVTGENGVLVDTGIYILNSNYDAINIYNSPRGWRIF